MLLGYGGGDRRACAVTVFFTVCRTYFMAHIGAKINTRCLAVGGVGRIGAGAANADIVFLGRADNDMALHYDIPIFVQHGEIGGTRRTWNDNCEFGRIQQNGDMGRIADDDGTGFFIKADQFGFIGRNA